MAIDGVLVAADLLLESAYLGHVVLDLVFQVLPEALDLFSLLATRRTASSDATNKRNITTGILSLLFRHQTTSNTLDIA
jgi:hypothetical protein